MVGAHCFSFALFAKTHQVHYRGAKHFSLEAANSQEGLALYQTNPISLTIMDLPLAAQPALEGISQIMSLNNNAKIIVTGIYSQSASIAKAPRARCHGFY